ncbi:hypothetical protein D3C80_2076630 [compost metagenome]
MLSLVGEQDAALVVAHHQDVKLGSVAADQVVIPNVGETGQEDARLAEQGQPLAPQHPLIAAGGDFQTFAGKAHGTSTG